MSAPDAAAATRWIRTPWGRFAAAALVLALLLGLGAIGLARHRADSRLAQLRADEAAQVAARAAA
ncbi:MAG: hypothetical protein AB9M60_24165, partial [Leptothrix sp. (in: b-proteobacteria)]